MPAAPVLVRPAIAADYPTFVRLLGELSVDDPTPTEDRFVVEFVPTTLIAEGRPGEALGYVFFHVMKDMAYVRHLVAAPEARRRGVGKALLAAVAERARAEGCSTWCLTVKPDNAAAIALYESVGMKRGYASRALRIDWALVDAAPADGERVRVRLVAPEEDERVEREAGLFPGQLTRGRLNERVLLVLEDEAGAVVGATIFHPGFPGGFPFRVARPSLAVPFLRGLRPHARPTDVFVNVLAENHPELADALLALGATVRLELVRMSGPLPDPLRPGPGPASSAA
jgi:ribosomal protein S18 acetylase RimI-like enzyme